VSILLIAAVCAGFAGCDSALYKTFHAFVFDTELSLEVWYRGRGADAAFAEMTGYMEELARAVNRNDPDSGVSRFNGAAAGERVEADGLLFDMTAAAIGYYEETGGAYDVSLGAINALWHTDALGLAQYGAGRGQPDGLPGGEEIAAALAVCGLARAADAADAYDRRHFALTESDGKKFLTKKTDGFTLDFNGMAKGYAADVLRGIAQKHGAASAYINVAGEIAFFGKRFDGNLDTPWAVAIDNPKPGGGLSICGFTTDRPGLATSGGYRRYYPYAYPADGAVVECCHISDGRVGLPAGITGSAGAWRNDPGRVVSATALADSAMRADAYATALCVMSFEEGIAFLKTADVEALLFTDDGRLAVRGAFSFAPDFTLYQAYERVTV
jgi:thiamine biosynthesis lipoprotein